MPADNATSRQRQRRVSAAKYAPPAALLRALTAGEPVDLDVLLDWHRHRCPEHLRSLSPDLAARFWYMPPLAQAVSTRVRVRYVEPE